MRELFAAGFAVIVGVFGAKASWSYEQVVNLAIYTVKSYNLYMSTLSPTPRKIARPKTRRAKLMRQFRFARKSFEIEGIHLSDEVSRTFEEYINEGCSEKQLHKRLQIHFKKYV
jgi:hypothetical protein